MSYKNLQNTPFKWKETHVKNDFLQDLLFYLFINVYYLFGKFYKKLNKWVTWLCGGQLVKHEQRKDDGPGTKGYQGGKLWAPSNGQEEEKEDLAQGDLCSPDLAYRWSCSLDPLLTSPPLACC